MLNAPTVKDICREECVSVSLWQRIGVELKNPDRITSRKMILGCAGFCYYPAMNDKKDPEISELLQKTLSDIEKLEIVWSVDEITLKKATGRMIFHLKGAGVGNA